MGNRNIFIRQESPLGVLMCMMMMMVTTSGSKLQTYTLLIAIRKWWYGKMTDALLYTYGRIIMSVWTALFFFVSNTRFHGFSTAFYTPSPSFYLFLSFIQLILHVPPKRTAFGWISSAKLTIIKNDDIRDYERANVK